MVRNEKLSVTAQQNERHKAILSGLLKQEDNKRCADCGTRGPTWASVNLGVFVCLNCSGALRLQHTYQQHADRLSFCTAADSISL